MNYSTRYRWVGVVCVAASLLLAASSATTQDQDQDQDQVAQLEEWQQQELQALVEVVKAALQGQVLTTEKPFSLKPAFLKGTDGNTYVPFTLVIDPAKVTASSLAIYLFVTEHVERDPETEDQTENQNGDEQQPPEIPQPVYETYYFVEVDPAAGEPIFIDRSFTAPGGDYDVYVALRDSAGGAVEEGSEPATVVMVLEEELAVPDLWTADLRTSTVILAQHMERMAAPLTPEEQITSPYTIGMTRIEPRHDTNFGKQEELSLILLVYNPALAGGLRTEDAEPAPETEDQNKDEQQASEIPEPVFPDVTVEYSFHQRTADGEQYWRKTSPQQFNEQTLPSGFDVALGHQIVTGQVVPLENFPAGDYRLEVKITDNTSGATVIQDVNFTVLET